MRMRILILAAVLAISGVSTTHAQTVQGVDESFEHDGQGNTWLVFKTRRPFIRGSKIEEEWKRSNKWILISECVWHREKLTRIGKCRYKDIFKNTPPG